MKYKKSKGDPQGSFREIFGLENTVNGTFISLDIDGNMVVEGFKKLIDYNRQAVQLSAGGKTVYIYGENLKIPACTRHTASVCGKIEKIEIFEGD